MRAARLLAIATISLLSGCLAPSSPTPTPPFQGPITALNETFEFPTDSTVSHDVRFSVPAGANNALGNVTLQGNANVGLGGNWKVTVASPSASSWCSSSDIVHAPTPTTGSEGCQLNLHAEPGTWTAWFNGTGGARVRLLVALT